VQQYQTKLHTGQNIHYLITFHLSAIVACGNVSYSHFYYQAEIKLSEKRCLSTASTEQHYDERPQWTTLSVE